MGRKSKSAGALDTFLGGDLTDGEVTLIQEEIGAASDRAVAVLVVAHLDALLADVLAARLHAGLTEDERTRLLGVEAPPRSFSTRCRMAHALGVFGPETRDDLDRIRKVRNAFAHSRRPLSFDTPQVREVCMKLGAVERWYGAPAPPEETARARFVNSTLILFGRLKEDSGKRYDRTTRDGLLP